MRDQAKLDEAFGDLLRVLSRATTVLDDTNKITAQQQQQQEEEEKGGNGVSTPPPHMQNLNSPRTTGGSKNPSRFGTIPLEEVKKYETTPTNGKKKKKSPMFKTTYPRLLGLNSSNDAPRALIRAAGSWSYPSTI